MAKLRLKQFDNVLTGSLDVSGSLGVSGSALTIDGKGSISGSAISTGSFGRLQSTNIDIDSIDGNWTNAGNTVADGGTFTTIDINGGTIDGITSLTAGGDLDIGSHDLRAATLTADSLTSGRVPFASTNGLLIDDSDFTFSTDTLTVTKLGAFQAVGAIDFNSQAMTNVDINSGTINGITDLAVADGGTGVSTFTDGGVLLGSGTDAITATAVLSNGQLLIGDNSGDPTLGTLTGTTNQITVTNGAGSITLSLPQSIHTDADVEFDSVTLDDLTATRLVATDGSKKLVSSDLNNWVAGTSNQISVADDSDGTITLSTPQNIHTSATPTFGTITTTGNITGSSTSTGSFGELHIADKIGIGTTNPDNSLLHVAGHINLDDDKAVAWGGGSSRPSILGNTSNNTLKFYTNGSERISVASSGKVGIGTANPTKELHVVGDAIVTGILTAQEFHTEFVSASVQYTSGSTKFGDTTDDLHSITGSLVITGSSLTIDSVGGVSGSSISTGSFGRVSVADDIYSEGRIYESGTSVIDHATAMAIVFGG